MSGPPVGLFGMVLGLGGLGLMWRETARRAAWLTDAAEAMLAIAAAAFVVLVILYGLKILRSPQAVRGEWRGPPHAFFAAIAMSVLVLAQGALPHARDVAHLLFWTGCAAQLALALAIMGRWIGGAFALPDLHPGWFLPAVGGMLATVVGMPLGETEISWLFFGFGVVTGLPLFALVLYRLCFVPPLPPPLAPTLVILIAPVALAFLAWNALAGGALDPFGRILCYAAFSVALIVAMRTRGLAAAPFGMGWWAVSFPLDLLSNATLTYARLAGAADMEWIGLSLAAFTSAVILYLFGRTLLTLGR